MSCDVTIRPATSSDGPARAELIRTGIMSHQREAFLQFFFQELTLQCCVLCGAVLFIFCGVSAGGCVLVLPVAALLVAAAVYSTHAVLADKHVQKMHNEQYGLVAEVRGSLLIQPQAATVCFVTEDEPMQIHRLSYSQVIGTVSVSEMWGPEDNWWLHGLTVLPQWQHKGVGGALLRGAARRGGSGVQGGQARPLHAVLSCVQHAARALLHKHQWSVSGSYHRQLGAGVTLQLVHLTLQPTRHEHTMQAHTI